MEQILETIVGWLWGSASHFHGIVCRTYISQLEASSSRSVICRIFSKQRLGKLFSKKDKVE